VADVRTDLLNDQGVTANDANLLGYLIPVPSPRQTVQSHETHQSQQMLQNNANEQVCMCGSPNSGGDRASAHNAVNTNDASTSNRVESSNATVETVLEDGSDDGQDNVDLSRNVQINVSARLSNASNGTDSTSRRTA